MLGSIFAIFLLVSDKFYAKKGSFYTLLISISDETNIGKLDQDLAIESAISELQFHYIQINFYQNMESAFDRNLIEISHQTDQT